MNQKENVYNLACRLNVNDKEVLYKYMADIERTFEESLLNQPITNNDNQMEIIYRRKIELEGVKRFTRAFTQSLEEMYKKGAMNE